MPKPEIHTIDLNFQGKKNTIGVFLIPHSNGGILIECGPGSTLTTLIRALRSYNLTPQDIHDVFLTHIHLDHAGSAGWWAQQGATIHVHSIGAPHLVQPEKLLASAGRIYGEQMTPLWGEFLPVPPDRINILKDGDQIQINGKTIQALDTPGHANHHLSYLYEDVCFSGDIGGVHIQGIKAIRLPTVPPEFNPEQWHQSIYKFKNQRIQAFATTHFGIHEDSQWHLAALEHALEQLEDWMDRIMPSDPSREEVRHRFNQWMNEQSSELGLSTDLIDAYNTAISSQMSADGIYRYWNKYRNTD